MEIYTRVRRRMFQRVDGLVLFVELPGLYGYPNSVSLEEFKKHDGKWLATLVTDGDFEANNYAKWFHVAEHESNHDGQIKFLKSRVPGAKAAG